ncbi:hypothetical protein, conserved [Babesia bigemina]|uniref:TFIIS N-terminal domain-containing protein n=1 Tax=Babesia bigemina TaxID=5866 RepID=A0A061DCS2_BABBI|nr:hypothetical protein, conserved [Babesia bigemina]CDR95735.1 hypothetical protein, conserved [Babesia bigemina]|eukprot:XP_012767921.1 hypothetical protein, conserved [Babesia bigemina]
MPSDDSSVSTQAPPGDLGEVGGAAVAPSRLRPVAGRIFSRAATLSKVDGLSDSVLEGLNSWYQEEWRVVHASRFAICPQLTDSLKRHFASRSSPSLTAESVESFLRTMSLLYYGLRSDSSPSGDVSKNKFFQRYYYTSRENAAALNSPIVMSNFVWACHRYMRDEFANTCLLDILLQAFPAALESFVRFGGVVYLKSALDYLAASGKLRSSTNYLLKALALLNKLDISFRTLQTSRIGIPINGIATGGKNVKMGIDYECENDNVKLKATDLIKKWKAIRDASQPMKVEPDPRRQVRRTPPAQANPAVPAPARPAQVTAVAERKADAPASRRPEPAPAPGSFVLNILDSMVEQREKERKRKLAMKEAQRNGLFKVSRVSESEGTSRPEEAPPAASVQPGAAPSNPPGAEGGTGGGEDKVAESRKELQSLMNFFKSFKPQIAPPHSSGESPQSSSSDAPVSSLPSASSSAPHSGDRTGLSVSSNHITHMNGVAAGTNSPRPAAPPPPPPSFHLGAAAASGSGSMPPVCVPPWK